MRHLYDKIHLGRSADHRRALFGNMSASLFLHRRIITTLAKAKSVRRYAERMITFARRGDLADRRLVASRVRNKEAVKILFDQLGPHFKNRDGGYTRIIHLGPRPGDAAPMAILELVGFDDLAAVQPESKAKSGGKSRLKASQKAAAEKADKSKSKAS
ncbi:MAG: 50S ribosomal protein L17 [Calditrichaeota bacterium]|nr:50S ribosomal protein L17 [Calditrichota bacterium]